MVYLSVIEYEAYRKQVLAMLECYKKMWSGYLVKIKGVSHRVELNPGTRLISQQPYRAHPQLRAFIEEQVSKMLSAEVIEPVQSHSSSPNVIATKKNGTTRFCVYYRKLSDINVVDYYPIPRMDDCFEIIGDSTVYSVLDSNWGYYQMPIAKEDRDITKFVINSGASC